MQRFLSSPKYFFNLIVTEESSRKIHIKPESALLSTLDLKMTEIHFYEIQLEM